jgi:GAF domain-containing protein
MTRLLEGLRAVTETGRQLATTPSLDAALTLIVESVARLTAAAHAAIVLRGADGGVSRFCAPPPSAREPATPLLDDVDVLARVLGDAGTAGRVRSADPSFIGIPVQLHDEILGALYLVGKAGGAPFGADDELVMEHFAHQAALAIGAACLLWQAQERAERLTALSRLTRHIRSTETMQEVCEAVSKAAVLLLGAAVARVWKRDPSTQRLDVRGGYAVDPQLAPTLLAERLGPCSRTTATEIIEAGAPLLTETVEPGRATRLTPEPRFGAYAGLPVATARRAFGVLSILFAEPRRFTPEDRELMALLADSAAIAIEGAHYFEEMELRRRESEALAEISRTINATLDIDALLPGIGEAARNLAAADVVLIALRDPDDDALRIRYTGGARYRHYDTVALPAGKGLCGEVLATGRPARTDDIADDPRVNPSHLPVIETEGSRAMIAVPLRIAGRIEGLLFVAHREPRAFTERDEGALMRLADHAALAIRNARLFTQTERRGRAAELIADIGRLILELAPLDDVAARIVESAHRLLGVRAAQIFTMREDDGTLVRLATAGALPGFVRDAVLPQAFGSMGVALRERRTVVIPDLLSDARIAVRPDARARAADASEAAALATPLLVRNRVIGALVAHDRTGRRFDADDRWLAEQLAYQAALALDNARLYAEAVAKAPGWGQPPGS